MAVTTIGQELALYINVDKPGGVNAAMAGSSNSAMSGDWTLMAGDTVTLKIYFRRPSTSSTTSDGIDFSAGSVVNVGGVYSGTLLFAVTGMTLTGDDTDPYYSGELNLATAAIVAAMAGLLPGESLSVTIDVEVRNAGNSARITYRVPCTLYKQVYEASDPTPAPSVVFPLESPSGYVFGMTIDDNGQLQIQRVL